MIGQPTVSAPASTSPLHALALLPPDKLQLLARSDPALYAEVKQLLDFDATEHDREEYEGSLIAFMIRAWREIEAKPLELNWHHVEIAEHLEAITFGEIRNLIINIPPRHTKALSCDTPVLTTWGWKTHGDIIPGDFVYGPDGWPKRVTGVSPKTIKPAYEVAFDDGSTIIACGEHLWAVEKDYPYGGPGSTRCRKPTIVQTTELTATVSGREPRSQTRPDRIPIAAPVQMPPRRLLIDPYTLGAWLGDGSTGSACLTVGMEDIEHFTRLGDIVMSADRNGDGRLVYRLRMEKDLQTRLRVMGILGNKHIPEDYFEASVDQRWELLRGLMDTDGTCTKDGACRFVTRLTAMGYDVAQLVRSLGMKAHQREAWSTLKGKRFGPYQEISFRPVNGERVFHLERKQARVRPQVSARIKGRYVVSVTLVEPRLVNCIKVEGELYLAGRAFVTTHNTLLANVIWPAWTWCRSEILPLSGPQVKFLCVSYGATLSEEIALKMKRLVMGDWYQRIWGERVRILEDQKARANFGNAAGGERMSTSIEGGLLGRGGDVQLIDDPQTRQGADSDAETARSLQGMSDLTTRVTDPRIAAKVLVMQRLRVNDATDWALKNWPTAPETVHLMFPARYEPDRACAADHRTYQGELLWPNVWSDKELTKIEMGLSALDGDVLSDYAISGQLQQFPIPRSGGIVNKGDWKVWPEYVPNLDDLKLAANGEAYIELPEVSHVMVSVDTAMSEKETADWTACVVIGIWHRRNSLISIVGQNASAVDDGEQPRVIVMGAWRMRGKLNDESINPRTRRPAGVVQRIVATARQYNADRVVIENKTRGLDVKNEIERQMMDMPFQVELFEPGRHGDKVARLHAVQPLFAQELIYAPGKYSQKFDQAGTPYLDVDEFEWFQDLVSEVESVPRGAHDDYADALTQALLVLRNDGYLALTQEYIAQRMAERMFRSHSKKVSVRDAYGV